MATNLAGVVAQGTWYTMTFSVEGGALTCTVTGGGLPSPQTLTDDDGPLPAAASVGFYAGTVQASFRNAQVTLLP